MKRGRCHALHFSAGLRRGQIVAVEPQDRFVLWPNGDIVPAETEAVEQILFGVEVFLRGLDATWYQRCTRVLCVCVAHKTHPQSPVHVAHAHPHHIAVPRQPHRAVDLVGAARAGGALPQGDHHAGQAARRVGEVLRPPALTMRLGVRVQHGKGQPIANVDHDVQGRFVGVTADDWRRNQRNHGQRRRRQRQRCWWLRWHVVRTAVVVCSGGKQQCGDRK